MMKMRGNVGGREVLLIGLSHANLNKLRAEGLEGGIQVKAEEHGLSCDVYITAAPTEHDMLEAFKHLIDPETKVHVSPKLKN